ncbi:MAG: Fe-S cluster assembly protein SufD [Xanthobacteraceae bacterium]
MNAEIKPMKTAAELALAETFAALKGMLPGAGEVAKLREAAFRNFDARGLPHRRVEEWKYTDLRALMREAKPLAPPPDAAAKARAKAAGKLVGDVECRRVVFVNGVFVPELSDLAGLEKGVTIRPMAQALASGDPLIAQYLGKAVGADDVAVALNTALMGDGAVIHVAAGAAVDRPLHLMFVGPDTSSSIFTRSLAVVEEGARAMLIESHEGGADADYQVNAALELVVRDKAHVDHVKLIGEGAKALHVSTLMATVGAHARFNTFSFTTGGAAVRNQMFLLLAGEETVAGSRGVNLLKGRQHADNTLIVDHAVPGCQSRELFKSVLDGDSHGIFQGKIVVRPGAQKTDARMMTQALLLSERAEAANKPELEIFADDVQCGHGATAGALDQNLLFYLRARGIPKKEAEALLIQSFVGEAIEGIEHAGLREVLMEAVTAWLAARG